MDGDLDRWELPAWYSAWKSLSGTPLDPLGWYSVTTSACADALLPEEGGDPLLRVQPVERVQVVAPQGAVALVSHDDYSELRRAISALPGLGIVYVPPDASTMAALLAEKMGFREQVEDFSRRLEEAREQIRAEYKEQLDRQKKEGMDAVWRDYGGTRRQPRGAIATLTARAISTLTAKRSRLSRGQPPTSRRICGRSLSSSLRSRSCY